MLPEERKGYKILIVDDSNIIRAMLKSIFKDRKYITVEADSGEMALDILPEVMPDLVLLDIMMTGIDGFEVLRRIRKSEKHQYTKVVLLSSKSDVDERLKGYELGADDYMAKPFVGGELRAKVNVFMRMNYIESQNLNLEELVDREVTKHKQQEEYLLSRAKLLSMGDMVIAIGHHWRQPLNALGLIIQDIQDAYQHGELNDEYIQHSTDNAMKQITFMSEIIDNFFQMMKDDKSEKVFSVTDTIAEVMLLIKDRMVNEEIDFSINSSVWETYLQDTTVTYFVRGREWILKQSFTNILLNAIDAIVARRKNNPADISRGEIKMKLWNSNDIIHITVVDNGEGIPDDKVERIFEPYFTMKEQGQGVGLGLYFSRTLIEKQLSGKFYIKKIDEVTTFVIELPCITSNTLN